MMTFSPADGIIKPRGNGCPMLEGSLYCFLRIFLFFKWLDLQKEIKPSSKSLTFYLHNGK